MDDSMLEREIEGLLSVDPAPDFRARVRHRIAQEPPLQTGGLAWRAMWTLATSAAVIAAATMLLIVLRVDAPPPVAKMPAAPPIHPPLVEVPTRPLAERTIVRSTSARKRPRGVAVRPMEVIVYAPEAAAWRRLLTRVHSGTLDLSTLTRASDDSPALTASEEFALPRIVIEPLAPEAPEQGVRP